MKFVKTGNLAGRTELYVNGKLVGQGEIPHTVAIPIGVDETFDIGQVTATAVSQHCKGAFHFNGEIDKVTVTLDDTPDPQASTSTGGKAVIDRAGFWWERLVAGLEAEVREHLRL